MKKIKLILIIVCILTINYKIYKNYNLKNKEAEIINIINQIKDKRVNINKNEINKDRTYLTKNYLGYIKIDKLGIKKLISYGTDNNILNKNIVGMHKASANIDDSFGNIILAGHNNEYVFKKLFNLHIGDEIILVSHIKCYKFKVYKINIYNLNNYSYYKNNNSDKILTLITCKSKNYRLVITAKIM